MAWLRSGQRRRRGSGSRRLSAMRPGVDRMSFSVRHSKQDRAGRSPGLRHVIVRCVETAIYLHDVGCFFARSPVPLIVRPRL